MRTAVLPFVFIFNPQILLIDVHGWFEFVRVVLASLVASLAFAAGTMGWFQTRCKWWETGVLLAATFMLFRPNYFMDFLYEPYREVRAQQLLRIAEETPPERSLVLVIEGTNVEGEQIRKTVGVPLGKAGNGRDRLAEAGLTLQASGDEVRILGVKFGSRAKRAGIEQGWKVAALKVAAERPSAHWIYVPGLALIALVWFVQRRRLQKRGQDPFSSRSEKGS
jgi:hypothetical protein